MDVNVNGSNFDESLACHQLLVFQKVVGIVTTITKTVAVAVGIPPYRVKGALVALANGLGMMIDLIEGQEPSDPAAYPVASYLSTMRTGHCSIWLDDIRHKRRRGIQSEQQDALTGIQHIKIMQQHLKKIGATDGSLSRPASAGWHQPRVL